MSTSTAFGTLPATIIPNLLYGGALLALVFTLITSGIFLYHWVSYGGNRHLTWLTVLTYLLGSLFLVSLMFGATIIYLG